MWHACETVITQTWMKVRVTKKETGRSNSA